MANRCVLLSALAFLTVSPLLCGQIPSEAGAAPGQQDGSSGCNDPLMAPGEDCLQSQQSTSGAAGGGSSILPISASLGNVPPNITSRSASSYEEKVQASERSREQPLLPDLPTEFQKFVAETTGQFLPLYGEDLFRRVPSTFAHSD